MEYLAILVSLIAVAVIVHFARKAVKDGESGGSGARIEPRDNDRV